MTGSNAYSFALIGPSSYARSSLDQEPLNMGVDVVILSFFDMSNQLIGLTDHPICNTTGKFTGERLKSVHLPIVEKRAESESSRKSEVPSR